MKFLCSILIFAGVLALNDAFPSSDVQMRLVRDQLMLEDLKQITDNRATSPECSAGYLGNLTIVLNNYNTNMKNCDDAEQTAVDELNREARGKIEDFNKEISSTCNNKCQDESSASDGLSCIEEETSASSRLLSEISVTAATYSVELNKAIDDTKGIKNVCVQLAYSEYSDQSQIAEDQFKNCVKQKEKEAGLIESE